MKKISPVSRRRSSCLLCNSECTVEGKTTRYYKPIYTKEREIRILKEVEDLFAQPPDRTSFPITKTEWTMFRDECITKLAKWMGNGER